jgi:DNA-binding LytR/AlgR family response regulator
MSIKIAICDDSMEDIERLKGDLLTFDASFEITTYTNGEMLIDDFIDDKLIVDILFLDIYMPQIDGVTTAQKIRGDYPDIKIIFLSSSNEFYQQAYELFAFNYILKPFEKDRLFSVMERALSEIGKEQRHKLQFRYKSVAYSVNCRDILYLESQNKIILLHMADKSTLQYYGKLDEIIHELPDKAFLRCHQSFIVNLFHIGEMGEKHFRVGENLIGISRKYLRTSKDEYYEHLFTNMGGEGIS